MMHDEWPLLSDERLNGTYSVDRLFRPPTPAQAVEKNDFSAASEHVMELCNSWGGAYMPLIPVDRDRPIEEVWIDLLDRSPVDGMNARGLLDPEPQLGHGFFTHQPTGLFLLRMLMDMPIPANHKTIQTARGVPADDPWYLSYLGTFGAHPHEIAPDTLKRHNIKAGFTYDDLLPIRAFSGTPGAADMLNRLREPNMITAVQLTLSQLGRTEAPLHRGFPSRDQLDFREYPASWHFGPNVVIVYRQGSVEDLALLWYLRALYGLPPGLPLAVPVDADVSTEIEYWRTRRAQQLWGAAGGGDIALVSASVSSDELERLTPGTGYKVAQAKDLLRPLGGCRLAVAETVHYIDGRAEVPRFVPTEIEALGHAALNEAGGWSSITTIVKDWFLPPSQTLRRSSYPSHGYLHGYIAQTSTDDSVLQIFHPTGLEVLAALARDHGQTVQPSPPGRAAAQLINMIGGMPGMDKLACPTVVDLLGELTRGRNSTIVKRQLRQFLKIDDQDSQTTTDRYRILEERLDRALAKPDVEDVSYKTVSEIRALTKLKAQSNSEWIRWGVDRGMLLRGFRADCPRCKHKQWRPLADTVPELICHGCGREIREPFGLDTTQLRYRASETLLRAMNLDVLSHILALRFLCRVWDNDPSGGPRNVFGAYPGLELVDDVSKEAVAEADIALVLANGKWVVGECKTTAVGLRESDLTKLWKFADCIDAAATFVATLQPSAECGEIWKRETSPTGRTHFALTAEHLFDLSAISLYGDKPLAWRTSYRTTEGSATSVVTNFDGFLKNVDVDNNRWRRAPWTRIEGL